jgi:LuxR family maltose regulon positive regulatory protein
MRGIAMLLEGDLEGADRALEDAVEVTEALGETVDQVIALAERSLLASARGAWDDAESLNAMAMSIVRRANLEEYATSALVYVAAARVALHGGDVSTANRYLVHVQRLREQLTHAVPHLAVQTRLELARAYVGLGEIAGARTLLREIGDLLRHRPDLGILVDQTDDLRAQLALRGSTTSGFQTLSPAELRLLPLLSTHFSFREIGEELFVSPHTVKSQAISIYRKLGVSSRSEAVQNARKIGLLEG